MAVKVSTLLRHLKRVKLTEKQEIRLLMPDGSTYLMPGFGHLLQACSQAMYGEVTPDSQAVLQAKAGKNVAGMLTLLHMVRSE